MTTRGRTLGRRVATGLAWGLALPLAWIPSPASGAVAPGTPWTWGSNGFGQLGNGTTSSTPSGPAAVPGLSDVQDVRGGREHVVALTTAGTVLVWGSNADGQLGLGDSANRSRPTAVTVPCSTGGVRAVTTGHYETFALCDNGTVWGWGLNADGQLGDGTRTLRRSPVQVQGITDAVSIAAGRDMAYAVRANGTVLAWGDNAYGELGDGTTTDRLTPVAVSGLTDVTSVAPGRDHALVLRQDGSVWAFGWNTYGQLGDGTTVNRSVPVEVTTGVAELCAGAHHSYARTTDGRVLSWGRNYRAELGDGTTTMRTRPVTVLGVSNAVSIGSGRDHGVAVLSNGSVMDWGYNANGQLGDGTTTNRTRAVTVPGVSGATLAGGGGAEYTVVLVSGPPANQPPHASISVSCQQLACHFDGGGSHDPDGTVESWSWDFGDQHQDAGVSVDHTFPRSGAFQVTLTVTDDEQATGSTTQTVTVSDGSSPPVTFDAVGTITGSFRSSSIRVPTQVDVGDELVLFVTTNRAATLATPAGWTLHGTVSDGGEVRSWTFSRTATSGVPGSMVPVSLSTTAKANATVLGYSGAAAPTAVQGRSEPGNTRLHMSPAAPIAVDGSVVVSYWADKVPAAHGWTLPAGITSRSATSGFGTAMITSTSGDTAAQPTGTWPGAVATAGATSAKAIAWTVVLPPA